MYSDTHVSFSLVAADKFVHAVIFKGASFCWEGGRGVGEGTQIFSGGVCRWDSSTSYHKQAQVQLHFGTLF